MAETVWLNDGLVDADEAAVSIFDAGLLHGAGLFETMRAAGGEVFRLDAHIGRMTASAEKLGIRLRSDRGGLRRAVRETLEANELGDARVRLTATAGSTRAEDKPGEGRGTVMVTATKLEPYPQEYYRRGMTVMITSYKQSGTDPTVGHKTINYLPRLLALRQAHQVQAGEALWFTPDNRLAEGCISNVFLVTDDRLFTPKLETPVLAGITRAVVLELAGGKRKKIEAQEGDLTIDDLLNADEVFLTNSIMGVMPVCRIERQTVGDEKPGELTRQLAEGYEALVRKECDSDG